MLEQDLNGAKPGYVKLSDDAARPAPFIGPPCKRPRRPVDAPQVRHRLRQRAIIVRLALLVPILLCVVTWCLGDTVLSGLCSVGNIEKNASYRTPLAPSRQGEPWEREEAVIAPQRAVGQRRCPDDCSHVSGGACACPACCWYRHNAHAAKAFMHLADCAWKATNRMLRCTFRLSSEPAAATSLLVRRPCAPRASCATGRCSRAPVRC